MHRFRVVQLKPRPAKRFRDMNQIIDSALGLSERWGKTFIDGDLYSPGMTRGKARYHEVYIICAFTNGDCVLWLSRSKRTVPMQTIASKMIRGSGPAFSDRASEHFKAIAERRITYEALEVLSGSRESKRYVDVFSTWR